jgi:hypothetical protein
MNNNNNWNPLNDLWDSYNEKLKENELTNIFSLKETDIDAIFWPEDLFMGEGELEDAKQFISERTQEMIQVIRYYKAVPPEMLSSYVLRSLIAGMLWQQDRIG